MNNHDPHRYDDMIDLPHHVSATRPQMSMLSRAAQFSPFAALTGYEEQIGETARLTEERIELDENRKETLDVCLRWLQAHLPDHPVVSFTYFVPDPLKEGGSYRTTLGVVKKIDRYRRKIVLFADNGLADGEEIDMDEIVEISR